MIYGEEAQRVTINSYEANIEEYIAKDNKKARVVSYWPGVEIFLNMMNKGDLILEIGSGDGLDAENIEAKGFRVMRTDITKGFIKRLAKLGYIAEEYDVLQGPKREFKAIYANAVFLHFNIEQFRRAVNNVWESLESQGLFCLGMKLGEFEGWRDKGLKGKRFFRLWDVSELESEIENSGFRVLKSYIAHEKDYVIVIAQALKKA